MTSAAPHFELSAGVLALDFANTWHDRRSGGAALDYTDLLEWSAEAGLLAPESARRLASSAARRPQEAAATITAAHDLGRAIYGVFHDLVAGQDPAADTLDALNHALATALSRLRLRPEGTCCTWTWSADEDDLDRMLWPVARSAAELLTSEQLDRVRECASPTCSWLFLDTSRNRSRKWCDMAVCGNRAKARRFYRRRRQADDVTDIP